MNLRALFFILMVIPFLGGFALGKNVELPEQNCRLDVPEGFSTTSPDDSNIVYSARLQGQNHSEQVISVFASKSTLRADSPVVAAEIRDLCSNKHLEVLAERTSVINGRKFLVTNVVSSQPQLAGVLFTTTTGDSLVTLIFIKYPSTDQSMDVDLDAIALVNSLKLIKPLTSEQSGGFLFSLSNMTILLIFLGAYAGFIFLRYFIGLFTS